MKNFSTTAKAVRLSQQFAVTITLLLIFPFVLSMINLEFAQNGKVHFFPAAIILTALIFGAEAIQRMDKPLGRHLC